MATFLLLFETIVIDGMENIWHGCKLGRVISDVAQIHQVFGSVQHHTPQASSGDPDGFDQVLTHIPVATPDQSH